MNKEVIPAFKLNHMRPSNFEVSNFLSEEDIRSLSKNGTKIIDAIDQTLLDIYAKGSYRSNYMKSMKVFEGKVFFAYEVENNDHAGGMAQNSEFYSKLSVVDSDGKVRLITQNKFYHAGLKGADNSLRIKKITSVVEESGKFVITCEMLTGGIRMYNI